MAEKTDTDPLCKYMEKVSYNTINERFCHYAQNARC